MRPRLEDQWYAVAECAFGRMRGRTLTPLQEMAVFLSGKGLSVNVAAADGYTPLLVAIK
jgi:hypothetical protein